MRFCILKEGIMRYFKMSIRMSIAAIALAVFPAAPAWSDGFVLIGNVKATGTKAPRGELKDIFIGRRKTWTEGEVVQVVLGPSGSPELRWLAEVFLGVPERTLVAKIRQEVFKGEMRKPVAAATEKECVDAVTANPGAVGVIRAESAGKLPAQVTVLEVY
jgi:hypothetical protein